ncbi:MAG: hypothetical protein HYZ75_09630 [Elusimicrobia bacterium]|nr:hypothetical protein [Elusimicrobiota bacterium]
MKRAPSCLAVAALLLAACKIESAPPAAPTGAAGWQTYEDDWIKASYPTGSQVVGAVDGRQDPAHPSLAIIPPPTVPGTVHGGLAIQLDGKNKGMILRDAIQSELRPDLEKGGLLLVGPKEFDVVNGRCLGALIISSAGDPCPDRAPFNGQGTCYTPFYKTQCDDAAGRRLEALSILSLGRAPNGLDPDAKREAAVYERIMNSLEFKKP